MTRFCVTVSAETVQAITAHCIGSAMLTHIASQSKGCSVEELITHFKQAGGYTAAGVVQALAFHLAMGWVSEAAADEVGQQPVGQQPAEAEQQPSAPIDPVPPAAKSKEEDPLLKVWDKLKWIQGWLKLKGRPHLVGQYPCLSSLSLEAETLRLWESLSPIGVRQMMELRRELVATTPSTPPRFAEECSRLVQLMDRVLPPVFPVF